MITRTYAVGEQNTVRRRDDHTGAWIDVSVPVGPIGPATLYDVMSDPTDPDRVCVVGGIFGQGSNTGILISNDAGATWIQPGGTWGKNKFNYEVWWVDTNTIWVVGDQGYVSVSTDGGLTFNETAARPGAGAYGNTATIHALDDQVAIVAGSITNSISVNNVLVWKTTDGGATWVTLNGGLTLVNSLVIPSEVTGAPEGIWMSPDQQRIIVTTNYCQFLSTNGGPSAGDIAVVSPEMTRSGKHLTWYPSHAASPDVFRHVGGPVIDVMESTDLGATWAVTRSGDFLTFNGAHFYSVTQGYYIIGNTTFETANGAFSGSATDVVGTVNQMNAVWTGPWPIEPIDPPCGTCPEGFSYNEATNLCERTETTPVICNPQNIFTVGEGTKLPGNYSAYGARFYEDATSRPFPLTQGAGTTITDAGAAPLNLVQTVATAPWNDRLNAVGVWNGAGNTPYNEWIGFTACIQIAEPKTYFIGISGDNYVRFRLDGQIVFVASTGSPDTFRNWFMIPLTLTAGTHIIELEGLNNGGAAAFGAEIYDSTEAALAAMTSTAEIDAVTVFSTKDKIGETFDLGENSGCLCPDGFALSNCNGELECVRFETAEYISCPCYLATNCEDSGDTIVVRFEDETFSPDLSLTYIFDIDPDKCYTLEETVCEDLDFDGEIDAPFVTILETFLDCVECAGECYLLTNCDTQETLVVQNDLIAYVGKVIQIYVDQDTTLCLFVQTIPCSGQTIVSLPGNIIECFDNCVDCLPPAPEPVPPLVIRDRTVKPGWNTKGCPPEYVEKVSCNFAEALYQEVASIRYGIEFCCNEDAQKWAIKKELLDLKVLYDPEACVSDENLCCPPCNLTAEIVIPCEPVTFLIGSISTLPDPPETFQYRIIYGTGESGLFEYRDENGVEQSIAVPSTRTGTSFILCIEYGSIRVNGQTVFAFNDQCLVMPCVTSIIPSIENLGTC